MSEDSNNKLPEENSGSGFSDGNSGLGDDWTWDAVVPETDTAHITLEDLSFSSVTSSAEESHTDSGSASDSPTDSDTDSSDEDTCAEEETEVDDGLCIVCGKPRKNSVSDLYCENCRQKYLRTNYGAGHVILAFVIMLAAVAGYIICFTTAGFCSDTAKLEKLSKQSLYSSASDVYSGLYEKNAAVNAGINSVFHSLNKSFTDKEWFSVGKRSSVSMLRSYSKTVSINGSDHENFISAVEEVLSEKELNQPQYSDIKGVYDFCKALIESSKKYTEGWQKYITTDQSTSNLSVQYDAAMKYLDTQKSESVSDKCVISYFRFLTAFYADQKNDKCLSYFKDACEEAGQYSYVFIPTYIEAAWQIESYDTVISLTKQSIKNTPDDASSYYYLVKALTFTGKLDEASGYCEDLLKYNPDGLDYYSMKAEILRRQSMFEEAVEVCDKGIAAGSDAEIYRQQAIAYMLLDKKDNALDAINQAYNITIQAAYSNSNVSVEVLNTTALISFICGDTDTYKEIVGLFKNENMTLEKSVTDCIKGEITVEDIFMTGRGDV